MKRRQKGNNNFSYFFIIFDWTVKWKLSYTDSLIKRRDDLSIFFFCRKEYFEQTITNVAFNLCETISLISVIRTNNNFAHKLQTQENNNRHLKFFKIICANLQNQMDLFSGSF